MQNFYTYVCEVLAGASRGFQVTLSATYSLFLSSRNNRFTLDWL
jgi:hypothetical protein